MISLLALWSLSAAFSSCVKLNLTLLIFVRLPYWPCTILWDVVLCVKSVMLVQARIGFLCEIPVGGIQVLRFLKWFLKAKGL